VNRNTYALAFCGLAVALNVVLGTVVGTLSLSWLFLDAMGTIFAAVLFGPWWGMGVGIVTNLVLGVTNGPTEIPFAVVNAAIGLSVGLIATRWGFGWLPAIGAGVLVAVLAPLLGTPIAILVFGGLTGGALDVLVMALTQAGSDIFTAAFLPRLGSNLVDKVVSCLLVVALVRQLPTSLLVRTGGRRHAA